MLVCTWSREEINTLCTDAWMESVKLKVLRVFFFLISFQQLSI